MIFLTLGILLSLDHSSLLDYSDIPQPGSKIHRPDDITHPTGFPQLTELLNAADISISADRMFFSSFICIYVYMLFCFSKNTVIHVAVR